MFKPKLVMFRWCRIVFAAALALWAEALFAAPASSTRGRRFRRHLEHDPNHATFTYTVNAITTQSKAVVGQPF